MTGLIRLAGLTLRNPVAAMAQLRALGLGMADRWALLALAAALSALFAGVLALAFPIDPAELTPADALTLSLVQRPLVLAVMQVIGVAIAAALVSQVGRLFGGTGNFADSLLALVWVDLLATAGEAVQLVLVLVMPPLAPILSLILVGLMVYLAVRMVGAVHGFRNPLLVALGMFGTVIAVGLILSLLVDTSHLTQLMSGEAQ